MSSEPPNKGIQNPNLNQKDRFCPPLNTNLNNQGRSPFNAFVTNELSPLTHVGNNNKGMFSRPIKKFSFSEQIHDFVLNQDPSSSNFPKEKDNLESYFNEDASYSPYLGISKLSHQPSMNFNNEENNSLNDIVNNKNIIENMLDPIAPGGSLENLKKMQPLVNYATPSSESEVNYKTPTFCHGTSINSDEYSYKSPKFAGTPQNSFHLDSSTPQRHALKSDSSSVDKVLIETEKNEKEHLEFMGCNCKKSRCLKLYCECFANEKFCVKNCNCFDCKNNVQNQELKKKAMNSILIKNPQAFSSKLSTRRETGPIRNTDQKPTLFIKKGCNCKKSNCRKKYCECYGVGLKCTDICKCEDCKNKENSNKKNAPSKNEDDEVIENNTLINKKHKKLRVESDEKKISQNNGNHNDADDSINDEVESKQRKKRKKN